MAERCAGRVLVGRNWMKVGVSGMKRQGFLVQMPGQDIKRSEAAGPVRMPHLQWQGHSQGFRAWNQYHEDQCQEK